MPYKILQMSADSGPGEVPGMLQLDVQKSVELKADGDDGLTRFTMLAYSGGPAKPAGWYRQVITDLSGMKVADNLPILMNHDLNQRIGHVEKANIARDKIVVDGVISCTNDQAKEVAADAKNGFPWQVSIGAQVQKIIAVDEGEKVSVNGRTFNGPVLVARQTVLREISFTPVGADPNTSAKFAANISSVGVISMDFEAWLKAKGFDLVNLSDAQQASLRQAYDAEQVSQKNQGQAGETPADGVKASGQAGTPVVETIEQTVDTIADRRKLEAAEVRRLGMIKQACKKHPKIEADAIEQGWTVEKAELEVFKASRPTAPSSHSGGGQSMTSEVLQAAMRMSGQESEETLLQEYNAEVMEQAYSLRRIGLRGVIQACCSMDGADLPRLGATEREIAQAGFSTSSLSTLLSNVGHRVMITAYRDTPSVVGKVATGRADSRLDRTKASSENLISKWRSRCCLKKNVKPYEMIRRTQILSPSNMNRSRGCLVRSTL